MNYTFVILTLVFSSLIVLNVTPAYAQTTESPTSASIVCNGGIAGTSDIICIMVIGINGIDITCESPGYSLSVKYHS